MGKLKASLFVTEIFLQQFSFAALFRPGVRYNFSLYGCKSSGYQLLKNITGYMKELRKCTLSFRTFTK